MSILIENIKELIQVEEDPKLLVKGSDMSELKTIKDAYLYIENGIIAAFGRMTDLNKQDIITGTKDVQVINATGRMVFPSFVDLH